MKDLKLSVVIPTKNRSYLVGYAIRSVLDQSYKNVELIVVDNDDTEDTYNELKKFSDDRIRYFRTGGLSMTENWSYGLTRATGDFVSAMEDKMILRSNALKEICDLIKEETEVVTWYTELLEKLLAGKAKSSGNIYEITSHKIAYQYLEDENTVFHNRKLHLEFPIIQKSFYSANILRELKNALGGGVCDGTAPDSFLAFGCLAVAEKILVVDKALSVLHNNHIGNGHKSWNKGKVFKGYVKSVGKQKFIETVPVKIINGWNGCVNDFFTIKKSVGGNLLEHNISKVRYYTRFFKEILRSFEAGAPIILDVAKWRIALLNESKEVQQKVKNILKRHQYPNKERHFLWLMILNIRALFRFSSIESNCQLQSDTTALEEFIRLDKAIR